MKIFITLFLFSIAWTSMAQNAPLNTFYAKYKHRPNTVAMALPGWLVKLGVNSSEAAEDIQPYRPLLRGLNSLKILVMEEKNYASKKEVNGLIRAAQKHQFVDLLSVKDQGTVVKIMMRVKKTKRQDIVKNVLLLVCDEREQLVLLTFNGRWKKSMLQKMLQENSKDINFTNELGRMVSL